MQLTGFSDTCFAKNDDFERFSVQYVMIFIHSRGIWPPLQTWIFVFALTKTKATFSENFPKPDQYDREAYRPKQGIMIYVEITNRTISSVLNFLEAEATFVESESWFWPYCGSRPVTESVNIPVT